MKKDNDKRKKVDLIVKIVLIIIIIILLIHNCVLKKGKDQNNVSPNGNVDVIDIKCDDNKCKPIATPSPTPKTITSLNFTQRNVSVRKGDTLKLVVSIKPTELNGSKLTWKSSDESIVTVDSNGVIKGIKEGTVTITVTSSNGKTAACIVKVTKEAVYVKEIKLSTDNASIKAGELTQINATIKPENATNRELVWSSSDPSIATVDSNGVVKGIKAGTVTITAKTKNGKVVAKSTITIEPSSIESLSFAQKNVSIKKDDSQTLIVEVKPTELSNTKLTWKSSYESIVTVDSNGVIKGLKEGTATITVTSSNGKTATCTVNVTKDDVAVQDIELNSNKTTIKNNEVIQISALIKPENATNRELVWESSDPSIATVDKNGIVRGLKSGTVTITAKTKDGKVKDTITLTIETVPTPTPMVIQSISFDKANVSVKKDGNLQLATKIEPAELSNTKLTWKSSDESVVTVDENGVITGLKEGTATITVTTSNGKTATCTVTVTSNEIPVQNITLSAAATTIEVGDTTQISAVIEPDNATNKELTWSSSDSSIATVDENGLVKGIKPGVVTIKAKTKDGKVEKTITITVKAIPTPTPTPTPDISDNFEIYDNDHTPVTWNGATDLKIFSRSIYDIDGVIAPESSNTYEFDVKNSTNSNIKYSITFVETNNSHINMKYKLKRNGTYIVSEYSSPESLKIVEQLLNTNSTDVYHLEWKWVSSDNDTQIGEGPEAKYSLKIKVEAESIDG